MQTLTQVIQQLKQNPISADILWAEYQSLWQSLGFSRTQVALWKASLALDHQNEHKAAYNVTQDLAEHLVSLLRQNQRPLPIAQVMRRLPAGVTMTEQQIRKLAQQHPKLQIKGPLLLLAQ